MIWVDLLRAVALLLVLEGIMPAVMPGRWRTILLRSESISPQNIRIFGFLCVVAGLGLLMASQWFG